MQFRRLLNVLRLFRDFSFGLGFSQREFNVVFDGHQRKFVRQKKRKNLPPSVTTSLLPSPIKGGPKEGTTPVTELRRLDPQAYTAPSPDGDTVRSGATVPLGFVPGPRRRGD